jgi:hypothetical protein
MNFESFQIFFNLSILKLNIVGSIFILCTNDAILIIWFPNRLDLQINQILAAIV